MLKVSPAQMHPFQAAAGDRFVNRLAQELYESFPEHFGMFEKDTMLSHVGSRIEFARAHGLTRESHVALLARTEAAVGEDFTSAPEGHWARAILTADTDAETKARQLNAILNDVEAHPDFVPLEDE